MRYTPHIALACALSIASMAQATGKKYLLFYGNSFSQSGGGVHLLVRDIATGAGHETPHVFGQLVGGQSLEYHYNTGTSVITSGVPPMEQWDAVVMQEYSTRPTTHPTDGNVPAFYSASQNLYQSVLDHSPNAQAVLFETWARAPGHFVYPGIWSEPAAMQAELRMYYDLADGMLDSMGTSEVAPVGDAFEAGGFDTSLYGGDLYHASNTGALAISLVLYGTIYDDTSVDDIDLSVVTTRLGLNQDQIDFAVGIANSVLVPAPASVSLMLAGGMLATRRRR